MNCGINKSSSKIQFLQQNVDKNPNKMHTCLEIGLELKIDYILFQESYINMETMTIISHFIYYYVILKCKETRPKVMIFIKKNSRFQFC